MAAQKNNEKKLANTQIKELKDINEWHKEHGYYAVPKNIIEAEDLSIYHSGWRRIVKLIKDGYLSYNPNYHFEDLVGCGNVSLTEKGLAAIR